MKISAVELSEFLHHEIQRVQPRDDLQARVDAALDRRIHPQMTGLQPQPSTQPIPECVAKTPLPNDVAIALLRDRLSRQSKRKLGIKDRTLLAVWLVWLEAELEGRAKL